MTIVVLCVSALVAGGASSAWTARCIVGSAPLRSRNYRGLDIPAAGGLAVLLGFLSGLGLIAVIHVVASGSLRLALAAAAAQPMAGAGLGFGLLGLWDDLAGQPGERGWRAHLAAARRGRATAGAIKVLGGGILAFVLVAPGSGNAPKAMLHAAVIALCANLFNLLDLRPGRASKVSLVAFGGLLAAGGPVAPGLAAAGGAVVAFLPYDLREKAMLGDVGANALGAIIGFGVVATASGIIELIVAVVLVGLQVLGDRPGLSAIIDRIPPLRRFDRLGRVPEPPRFSP